MRPPRKLTIPLVALSLVGIGCQRKPPAPKGQPVAMLGEVVLVTSDDLQAELSNRSPTLPSGKIDVATRRDVLDKMIQFELLNREAEREGLRSDDEVQRQLKKAMLNRFVQANLERDPRVAPDTDAELMAFYEQHKSDYAKPARLRLLLVEFKEGGAAGPPPAARKAVAELKANGPSTAAFSSLARRVSADERTRAKGGETDWMTREDLAARYGDPVVAAAERLQPVQTSDLVRGKDGWFLVQLAGKQEATNPNFEQLKSVLLARAYHDKRAILAQAYEDDLRKRSPVQIDEEALAKVDPLHLGDEKPAPDMPAK